MMTKRTLLAGMALAAATLPALAEEPGAATVVATVNGTEITLGEMIIARNGLPPEYQGLPDDMLFKGLLDQLIQQTVMMQEMEGKLSRTDELAIADQRRAYIAGALVQALATEALTDEAVQAAYDVRYAEFQPQTEYHAAHILVDSEEKAKALLAQIEGGADFATLAAENSSDGTAQNGGDLGWFGLGMMVKPFEDAVVAAEVGKVAGPVQTDFGWHLILVSETRNTEKPTLDAVRPDLEAEVQKAAVVAAVDALVAAAEVTRPGEGLDPALLKDTTLLDK